MKKSIKLLGLLLTALLFSGCMKVNTDVVINKDGSVDYSYTAAISTKMEEYAKQMGGNSLEGSDSTTNSLITDEDKEEAKNKGYIIEDYNQDGFKGVKITKHFNSIDEISTTDEVNITTSIFEEDNQKLFNVKKGFLTNKYSTKISYSKEKEEKDSLAKYNSDEYKQYLEGFELNYSVTLPSKALSTNATSVDGNKLTWDLTKFDSDSIEYEFEIINTKNLIILIVGIVVVITAIVLVTLIIIKKKKTIN